MEEENDQVELTRVESVQAFLDERYVERKPLRTSLLGQLEVGTRKDGRVEVIKRSLKEMMYTLGDRVAEDARTEIAVMERVCCGEGAHPGFVRLLEAVDDDKLFCVVIEYIAGGDVCEHLQTHGAFEVEQARRYSRQVAEALLHLHQTGYCHLDVSPENLLYDRELDRLKLCDFGLSRRMTPGYAFRPGGTRPGKRGYMAPEIYNFHEYHGDLADVFSLGILMFILLAGCPPFTVPDPQDPCFRLVYNKDLTFLVSKWGLLDKVPPLARDLLNSMFKPADQRLTMEQVCAHPWIADAARTPPSSPTPPPEVEEAEAAMPMEEATMAIEEEPQFDLQYGDGITLAECKMDEPMVPAMVVEEEEDGTRSKSPSPSPSPSPQPLDVDTDVEEEELADAEQARQAEVAFPLASVRVLGIDEEAAKAWGWAASPVPSSSSVAAVPSAAPRVSEPHDCGDPPAAAVAAAAGGGGGGGGGGGKGAPPPKSCAQVNEPPLKRRHTSSSSSSSACSSVSALAEAKELGRSGRVAPPGTAPPGFAGGDEGEEKEEGPQEELATTA